MLNRLCKDTVHSYSSRQSDSYSTSDESTASSDVTTVDSVDHQPDYVISSSNQKLLQRKIIDAIRCGHLSVLRKIHTELPNFSFNFSHTFRTVSSSLSSIIIIYITYLLFHHQSRAMRPLQYACKCSRKDVIEWLLTSVADLERECLTKVSIMVTRDTVKGEIFILNATKSNTWKVLFT